MLSPKGREAPTNDLHRQFWPIIGTCGYVLDFPKGEHAVDYFPEDDVFAVEEIAFGGGYEELSGYMVNALLMVKVKEKRRPSRGRGPLT